MPGSSALKWRRVFLPAVCLASMGCYQAIDLGGVCHPGRPECADQDFDGDGVANALDAFPLDKACSTQDEANCGACGKSCQAGQICDGGQCVAGCKGDSDCPHFCADRKCVECRNEADCTGTDARCNAGACCVPACDGKVCGDDGCDGACGQCDEGLFCVSGQCLQCAPDCSGKACGDDGCGGSCGACTGTDTCQSGQCAACVPDCAGKECGDDGCGGNCGNACPSGTSCLDPVEFGLQPHQYPEYRNTCLKSCDRLPSAYQDPEYACMERTTRGRCQQAPDAYWGVFIPETCSPGTHCHFGVCTTDTGPSCSGRQCGDDGMGGSCGTCGSGKVCTDGLHYWWSGKAGGDPEGYQPAGYQCVENQWCREDLNHGKCVNSTTIDKCTWLAQDMGGWFMAVEIRAQIRMPCADPEEVCTEPEWDTSKAFCSMP